MKTITLPLALFLLVLPALGGAATAAFDRAMSAVFAEYETIHKSLSSDTTKGVAASANKISKLVAKVDASSVQGKHAAHYKHLPMKIRSAATKLAKAKGIAKQREAFMELSRPLAMWATMSKPAGINVVFCSMAKGSWLQRDKKIANPYYGAKMLRCGEVVSGQHKGAAGGQMKAGHSH